MTKRKLTWLDIALIVVLILLVVGVAWYFTRGDQGITGSQQQYVVTMRFTRMTDHPTDYYQVGDVLYQKSKAPLGTVLQLEEKDLVTEELNPETGEYQLVTDPEKKQIEMKVLASGDLESGKLTIGGEEVYIGLQFYPQSATTRSVMMVWDIEVYEEEAA